MIEFAVDQDVLFIAYGLLLVLALGLYLLGVLQGKNNGWDVPPFPVIFLALGGVVGVMLFIIGFVSLLNQGVTVQ